MKTCKKCGVEKRDTAFDIRAAGSPVRRGVCRACRVNHATPTLYQKNKERLQLLKAGRACQDCGGFFHPNVLEFDHRDRATKLGEIGKMIVGSGWKNILAEIAKCDLVCSCCHRLRTHTHVFASRSYPRLERHRALLRQLKTDNPCSDCKKFFAPQQMDFDHVRGDKFKPVSQLLHHSTQVIVDEIAKCEIVCANCHRVRTQQRKAAA